MRTAMDLAASRIGLVLSGGGARGISHIGVLKALEERNVHISEISGASAGAIVGSMFAAGYSPEIMLKEFISTNFFKLLRPAMTWSGLLSTETVHTLLSQYLGDKNFEDLQIPITMSATNIKTGKPKYFSTGPLVQAIVASSCIPVIFNPVEIDGEKYVDGGVVANMPSKPLKGSCDLIIGSNCNIIDRKFDSLNMKRLFERTMILATAANVKSGKRNCTFTIEPKILSTYGGFDIGKAEEIYQAGYEEACKKLDKFLLGGSKNKAVA